MFSRTLELNLSDTSIRAYKKRNGKISLHLRSYLMVHTDKSFSLSSYLKSIECCLILQDGTKVDFDKILYSCSCEYALETMKHHFSASTITNLTDIHGGLAVLHVKYHFNFTGHSHEEPNSFEKIVPLVKRY